MFYSCVIPALALSVFMIFKLRRIKKHDVILYRFCDIRRDALSLIDQRGSEFSRAGYHSTRNLLENLNVMIHNYDGCKIHVFNVRRLIEALKQYRHSSRQVDKIQLPNDPEIVALHQRFRHAMLEAFLTYTPWIRSEILAFALMSLLKVLAKLGIKPLVSVGNYLTWLVDEIKNQNNHNNPLTA